MANLDHFMPGDPGFAPGEPGVKGIAEESAEGFLIRVQDLPEA
jgi:hypothetical protein